MIEHYSKVDDVSAKPPYVLSFPNGHIKHIVSLVLIGLQVPLRTWWLYFVWRCFWPLLHLLSQLFGGQAGLPFPLGGWKLESGAHRALSPCKLYKYSLRLSDGEQNIENHQLSLSAQMLPSLLLLRFFLIYFVWWKRSMLKTNAFFFSHWSRVVLPGCVSFCRAAKCISFMHTHTPSCLDSLLTWVFTE